MKIQFNKHLQRISLSILLIIFSYVSAFATNPNLEELKNKQELVTFRLLGKLTPMSVDDNNSNSLIFDLPLIPPVTITSTSTLQYKPTPTGTATTTILTWCEGDAGYGYPVLDAGVPLGGIYSVTVLDNGNTGNLSLNPSTGEFSQLVSSSGNFLITYTQSYISFYFLLLLI